MASTSGSPLRYQTNQRDEAFDRVRRTTRWVMASAVLGTGVLVGVVAQELPAHSANAKSTGTAGTSNGTSGTSGTGSSSTGTSSSSGSTTGSATAGSTTGTSSTSGSSVSQGSQQSAHAVTGQS